jgi:hypothetical protein
MSAIGSASILLSHFFWCSGTAAFSSYCTVVALFCAIVFYISGSMLGASLTPSNAGEQLPSFSALRSSLLSLRNFWVFCAFGLIQVFNCHFNSNFLAITLRTLASNESDNSTARDLTESLVLAAAAMLPHIIVVLLAPVVERRSVYVVVKWLVALKIAVSLLFFNFGGSGGSALALILANKVFTEAICRHSGLILSDIVDEFSSLSHRSSEAISATLFGVNAFFTKPGQSLAPIAGRSMMLQRDRGSLLSTASLVPLACGSLQSVLLAMLTPRFENPLAKDM